MPSVSGHMCLSHGASHNTPLSYLSSCLLLPQHGRSFHTWFLAMVFQRLDQVLTFTQSKFTMYRYIAGQQMIWDVVVVIILNVMSKKNLFRYGPKLIFT